MSLLPLLVISKGRHHALCPQLCLCVCVYVCFCLSLTSSERLMYDRPAPIRSLLDHVDGLLVQVYVCLYV